MSAAAGFRVVAPDRRGYNLSSRPEGVEAYSADLLAADVRGLIRELGSESASLVGHDWGGTVAWATAMGYPEVVDRLAILNASHPRWLNEGMRTPNKPAPEALLLRLLRPAPGASRAHCARQALALLPALSARRPPSVYLPPLQDIFATAALGPVELAVLASFPPIVWGSDELRRWWIRRQQAASEASSVLLG